MNIETEFSRYAQSYDKYNIIQKKVIKHLLNRVKSKPKKILDIGCGRGGVYNEIDWDFNYFLGIDFAKEMLRFHPTSEKIELICADFNKADIFYELKNRDFDFIFSSSALQWSDDLEEVFKNIKALNRPFALAIFTDGTFKTLHKTANVEPLLKSSEYIKALNEKYFGVEFEIKRYSLKFDSTIEALGYIKKSGVSGSRGVLSYKDSKRLINEYPLSYLEFEVAFIYFK